MDGLLDQPAAAAEAGAVAAPPGGAAGTWRSAQRTGTETMGQLQPAHGNRPLRPGAIVQASGLPSDIRPSLIYRFKSLATPLVVPLLPQTEFMFREK